MSRKWGKKAWQDAQAERLKAAENKLKRAAGQAEPEPAAVPTFSECVIGYRVWSVDPFGRLRPQSVDMRPWVPGVNKAKCDANHQGGWFFVGAGPVPKKHKAPHKDCSCGLYARFDDESVGEVQYPDNVDRLTAPIVMGAVAAWGDLQVHADGFRAEKACVVALALTENMPALVRELVERVADRYGVPAVPRGSLAHEAGMHGSPLPEDVRPPRLCATDHFYSFGGQVTFGPGNYVVQQSGPVIYVTTSGNGSGGVSWVALDPAEDEDEPEAA